jgi:hypothetical protein
MMAVVAGWGWGPCALMSMCVAALLEAIDGVFRQQNRQAGVFLYQVRVMMRGLCRSSAECHFFRKGSQANCQEQFSS